MFWRYIRWFHAPARRVLVATQSIGGELRAQGLDRLQPWSRGVDLACFNPAAPPPPEYAAMERPIQLYVGRVAVEKNLSSFLGGAYPGTRVVVGDGPSLERLRAQFPAAHFLGRRSGAGLAGCYAGADVFVFPSRTDTFGLVMIEALACGTPVAAYPVAGPLDIVTADVGALSEDLDRAIGAALFCDPAGLRGARLALQLGCRDPPVPRRPRRAGHRLPAGWLRRGWSGFACRTRPAGLHHSCNGRPARGGPSIFGYPQKARQWPSNPNP